MLECTVLAARVGTEIFSTKTNQKLAESAQLHGCSATLCCQTCHSRSLSLSPSNCLSKSTSSENLPFGITKMSIKRKRQRLVWQMGILISSLFAIPGKSERARKIVGASWGLFLVCLLPTSSLPLLLFFVSRLSPAEIASFACPTKQLSTLLVARNSSNSACCNSHLLILLLSAFVLPATLFAAFYFSFGYSLVASLRDCLAALDCRCLIVQNKLAL